MNAKARRRAGQLFALFGSSNAGERENAWRKLDELLRRHGKTWNDLRGILAEEATATTPSPDPRDANPSDAHPFDTFSPADTARGIVESYVALEPHEYVATSLWAIHTHVYDQFMVTPRLMLKSPVRNCGKTTLLDVLSRLVARAEKDDNITAAAIMYAVHQTKRTLLLDEADNLDMAAKATLRAVLNAGHRKGGTRTLMVKGSVKRFDVFAPIALASIGTLPLPMMSRSIVSNMRRHDGSRPLRRFDADDVGDLDIVYGHIRHWLQGVQLNRDPDMPVELRDRQADNWRPLIAIADACGPAWGALAREAAIAFATGDRDEDLAVTLLRHLRQIFNASGAERLASKLLIEELLELDEVWSEYRGPRGDERPRKLTQGALALLLRPFGVRPRKFWLSRQPAQTCRGYFRSDLEIAWRAYCTEPGTPEQRTGVKRLRSVSDD